MSRSIKKRCILFAFILLSPFVCFVLHSNISFALTESDCRQCHGQSLSDRHHLLVQDGKYDCLFCHKMKWNDVTKSYYVEIIRDCTVCHSSEPHEAAHDRAIIPYTDCSRCHADNVVREHIANRKLECSVCHASTDANIQGVIARGKNGIYVYCSDCHMTFGNHYIQHDRAGLPSNNCASCHSQGFIGIHEKATVPAYCFTCHQSTNKNILTTIDSGMAGNAVYCSNCHSVIHGVGNTPPCS